MDELNERPTFEDDADYREYPADWTAGDWEEGFECTDVPVAGGSSSNTAPDFTVGDSFEDKKELQKHVKLWHIENARQMKTQRSTPSLIVFECVDPTCHWYLRATTKFFGKWRITKLGPPHSCVNNEPINQHRQVDGRLIFGLIYPYVKGNNGIKICDLQQVVKDKYGCMPTYRKVWYAKSMVIEDLYGSHESAFGRFPRQMVAMRHYNPGTIFDYDWKRVDEEGVATFGKWFWSFAPAIQGFPHCRPIISIDGTHLYGKYTGKLLVAVGYDADNGIVPLAFCLCDSESTETWTWFLERLRQHVTRDEREVCIISDRHGGIKRAVREVFPAPHGLPRYCARHLASNFNTHFKNIHLKKRFEEMIYTTNKEKFLQQLEAWYSADDGKYKSFLDSCGSYSKWSRSHDGGARYGNMTTNHSEVFNKVLKNARSLPITALLDVSFCRSNTYWVNRTAQGLKESAEGHVFLGKIRGHLHEADAQSRGFNAITYTYGVKYKIEEREDVSYMVDLREKECECGEWTLYRYPCKHAVCAIRAANSEVSSFVDRQFGLAFYMRTYGHPFQPLLQPHKWPEWEGPPVVGDPRMLVPGKGRKKVRIHNEMDTSRPAKKKKCSKCGQEGHNRRTCTSTT